MVTSYPARKSTGTRSRDVQDPLYKEAEERVYRWLQEQGYSVSDERKAKTFYDFRIGSKTPAIFALDVKCDQYAATTGRVAWELFVEVGKNIREGWGRDERLDYVAFVIPHEWGVVMVDTDCVRALIAKQEQGFNLPREGELVAFRKEGQDGRTAHGVALALEYLRRHGCIKREESLDGTAEAGTDSG